MEMTITKVAEADGKCFKCGNHCMKCDCWLEGIIDISECKADLHHEN